MVKKKWILFALAAAAVGIFATLTLLQTQARVGAVAADAYGFTVTFAWEEPIKSVTLFYNSTHEKGVTAGRCTAVEYGEKYLMRCRLPASLKPGSVYQYDVFAIGSRGIYRVLWGAVRVGN